jgi:hypothetical protein
VSNLVGVKPSNSRSDVDKPLASNVNVRKLRKMYREHKVNVYE